MDGGHGGSGDDGRGETAAGGRGGQRFAASIAIGVGGGAAIGVATGDLVLWLSIGLAFGVAIGSGLEHAGQDERG